MMGVTNICVIRHKVTQSEGIYTKNLTIQLFVTYDGIDHREEYTTTILKNVLFIITF